MPESDVESGGVTAMLAAGAGALDGVAGVDGALDALAERWRALAIEVDDLSGELRRYAEGLEAEPGALDAAEERLAVLERLERKHGGTIAAVLAHAETCRGRRDELLGAEEALDGATAELAAAQASSWPSARRSCPARGTRRRRGWRGPCARDWPSWPCPTRRSRSRSRSASRGRRAPTRSSSRSRPTRACLPVRCARSPPAASSRA